MGYDGLSVTRPASRTVAAIRLKSSDGKQPSAKKIDKNDGAMDAHGQNGKASKLL
jgi:hypothetical protein